MFGGIISSCFCYSPCSYSFFDASGNDLSGSIPSNFLAGSLLADHDIYIILANNEISGTIPESLELLLKLDINLADNLITGIPEVLCDNNDWYVTCGPVTKISNVPCSQSVPHSTGWVGMSVYLQAALPCYVLPAPSVNRAEREWSTLVCPVTDLYRHRSLDRHIALTIHPKGLFLSTFSGQQEVNNGQTTLYGRQMLQSVAGTVFRATVTSRTTMV
jgi:hypothetical protein